MAKAGYSIVTGGAVALTAATAKTILGVLAPASFGIDLQYVEVGFDGVTAGAAPVLVEVATCTFGANPPATNSTSVTPTQIYGRAITVGATAAKTWTTEPTTIATISEKLLTPYGGLVIYDWPLGRTPDNAVSTGFVLRCTAPAAVNVRASMVFERI